MSSSLFYKMSQRHFSKMPYVALDEMFFRMVCKMSSIFANATFLRRLKYILQRCFQVIFNHSLENYLLKLSKNCLFEMSFIPLYEMSFRQLCEISSRFANLTSFKRLKDILLRCIVFIRYLSADWVVSPFGTLNISVNKKSSKQSQMN